MPSAAPAARWGRDPDVSRLEILIVAVAFGFLGFILTLVRRRQLREKYALLWLGVGGMGILLSVARPLLDRLAVALGISYGPSLLFLFSTVFLMAVAAHLSWEVSRLEDKTRRLAEEIALMRPRPPTGTVGADGAESDAELDLRGADATPASRPGGEPGGAPAGG